MKRALFLFLISLVPAAAPLAQGFDDEFNSMIMKTGWTWVREDRAHWQFTGTDLQITTQPGALNGMQYNDVKNILLQPAPTVTFRFETKLEFTPDSSYHNAGLIYYIDDDNYVRVSRGIYKQNNAPDINGVWMEWEINGIPDLVWVDNITMNPIHLRLSRTNGTYFFASYGPDGTIWRKINDATILYQSGSAKVGLQAANGQGVLATSSRIPARFDYFHILNTSREAVPEAAASAPEILRLYPQPLSSDNSATLQYFLPVTADLTVRVSDMLGRVVWSQYSREAGGTHELQIPAATLRAGTYWLHMTAGQGNTTRKMVIIR
jgi:hypothetical protein